MMRVEAPDTRTVCQHTGTVLTADGLRLANDNLARLAKLAQERDDARAELDNVMCDFKRLGQAIADMTANTQAWQTDRDEYRERADEWRDKAESYLVTIDELQAEIRELRGES